MLPIMQKKKPMKNWTKEEALDSLDKLIEKIPQLKSQSRNSTDHMRWIVNALRIVQEIFGQNSRYYQTLYCFSWKETGEMLIQDWDIQGAIEDRHKLAFQNQLEQAKGLLLAAKDHLYQSKINEVYDGENTAPEASEL